MTRVMSNRGWLAAFAAAILCLVAAVGIVSTAQAAGSVTSLSATSATTTPVSDVTISVQVSGSAVGAWGINVAYDPSLVTPTSCSGGDNGTCNLQSPTKNNAVYLNGSKLSGVSGSNVTLGTITFHAGATTGTSPLTVTLTTLADTDTNAITGVTPTNGSITIATPTASPSPSPSPTVAATAAPTATAAALPKSGGPLGDSSSISLAWLLGAAALMVVAGGAWTLARARREEN
jgi:hypothetical protein